MLYSARSELLAILLAMSTTSSRPAPKTSLTTGFSIAQLLVEGGRLLEAESMVLVVVGASDRDGLSITLIVEQNELARVACNCARISLYLGNVLVVEDRQFEGVPCADASGVGSDGGGACVHLLAMPGV
jgi:hypothetical protein